MTSPFRNSLISKIHIAKKELAMEEADYRAFLERVTGKTSSGKMDHQELTKVLDEMKGLGFKSKPGKGVKPTAATDNPQASKIRALWVTLDQMGALRDGSEAGLAAFVKKQAGVDDVQWLNTGEADKVIKALRGWITRAGGSPNEY